MSVFEHIGKGVFKALLVITLPILVVWFFYETLERWHKDVRDMPVFKTVQQDFKTGGELVGTTFAAELKEFYRDMPPETTEDDPVTPEQQQYETLPSEMPHRFWDREEVERQVYAQLSPKHRTNASAYLDYIELHKSAAQAEMKKYKIPASVTIAQGLLETNAGRSFLARQANNHFGIKCRTRPNFKKDGIQHTDFYPHALAFDCVQLHDDYHWDRFEVYASTRASFRRHSLLLCDRRYRRMIDAYPVGGMYEIEKPLYGSRRVPYYAAWCSGLKMAGYATAPRYAETLVLLVDTYELWRLDYELF